MKYYVVGPAIELVDGKQPTKDALLASLEVLKDEKTITAFKARQEAKKFLAEKFDEDTAETMSPIFEVDVKGKQKMQYHKLANGQVIAGREIAVENVHVDAALLNLTNKDFDDVEIDLALTDAKAPVAAATVIAKDPVTATEEPAVTEEPAAKTEEAAATETATEEKPSAIRSLFSKLKNAFFSMYVQIPLIGFGVAMQGGTAPILEMLAKLGVTTAYPLVLEAGVALALGAVFYGIGQAIVWGVSSAYNAITKKSEKSSEEAGKEAAVDPELTAKLADKLDTTKDAANEAKATTDAEVEAAIANSPKVVRMSPKSSPEVSSAESSPKSSNSAKSSSSASASVSDDEEVSTKKKATVRNKAK